MAPEANERKHSQRHRYSAQRNDMIATHSVVRLVRWSNRPLGNSTSLLLFSVLQRAVSQATHARMSGARKRPVTACISATYRDVTWVQVSNEPAGIAASWLLCKFLPSENVEVTR